MEVDNHTRIFFYSGIGLLSFMLFYISLEEGMFWDNVLFASKMGNHLYNEGLFHFSMPDSFDPGHPPFLAFILALNWRIFGHSLLVSHLAMLPFVFGLLVQLYLLASFFVQKRVHCIAAFCLMLADPTLGAQLVLVGPEVIQLFFFTWAINSILRHRLIWKTVALALLSIVTFRGMMLCAGLICFDFYYQTGLRQRPLKSVANLKQIMSYFFAILPASGYIIWRLTTKGWLQTHPGSPWEMLWHFASPKIFVFNCVVVVHRFMDFGRVFIFIFLLVTLWKRKQLLQVSSYRTLIVISGMSVFIIVIISLLSTNTIGHRYFIASYITVILLAFHVLEKLHYGKFFYCLLLFGLISGNFWIYPKKISEGWDATLAHIPYFELRGKAIEYLNGQHINISDVGTFFPNITSIDNVDLSGDKRSFSAFDGQNPYVLYASVFNLTRQELYDLETRYRKIKIFKKRYIQVIIFQRNNSIASVSSPICWR